MRLLIAALILTLGVAVTAATFAIWPVVADAPWEDTTEPVVEDRTDEIRCQAALDLSAAILKDGRDAYRTGVRDPESCGSEYRLQLAHADRDIDRFC